MRRFSLILIALVCAGAQEAIHYGSVAGRVTDPSGAAVANAAVRARQEETNRTSATVTDSEGRFRLPYLRIGQYEIRVLAPGFAAFAQHVDLSAGAAFDLPVVLSVAAAATNVTVRAEAAMLDAARSQIAGTVARGEMNTLPLNGRSFLDVTLLAPGVSPTNTGSNQLFAETSAVPGQGISVASQRNFSNSFIVDGLSANDDAAGLSGIFYSLDAIDELQVVTSGAQAELGRALGGYVNLVTRSGANSLHGDLYGYFRNQRLNAANPLSHTRLPSTQAQYGASLGGPVIHDRTFYFANFEQRDLSQSGLVTIAPASVAAINQRLAGIGYAGAPVVTGLYPNPVHSSNVLGKVDHQFAPRDQFSVRYSAYHVTSRNSRGAGALSAPTASADLADTDQSVAAGNVATLSPRTVNETRGQFAKSNLDAPPTDPLGPAVSIAGVASFGTLSNSPTGRANRLYELVDNFSHQWGAHAFRAGVDFLYNDLGIAFPRAARGSYAFASLSSFLAGVYNNAGYTQTFGPSFVQQTNPNAGWYVQDEWKAGERLTLNVGIRYDLQFLRSIAADTNNVAPRVGFAWTPTASRRMVVRGGFGFFYDRVPLRALANALLSSASQISVSLSPSQAGAPVFPNVLSTVPSGMMVNFTTMDLHMQNAYSEQGNLEIERQVGENGVLRIGYQHLRGLHLIASINQNAPSCVAAGNNNGCRPDPAYANNSQYSPAGDSRYDGLEVSFVERPVRWGSVRLSYTFSKALDDVGEFFFSSPLDNHNIHLDYGRSDDDQQHRFVMDGTASARGFRFTGLLQYYSALPLNIVTGTNTVQGTAARPAGRNTGIGNDFFSLGTRVGRTIRMTDRWRLEAILEAFNALNHRNNLSKNGIFGTGLYPVNPSSAFGQITAVNDPRVLQVAIRLTF